MIASLVICLILGPVPLARAHSHNDYAHKRPLLDALEAGFTSVEADIFLVEGKLLVGHSKAELKPERSLEALYLEPLHRKFEESGAIFDHSPWLGTPPEPEPGRPEVFDSQFPYQPAYGQTFQLLIDVKANGAKAYPVLASLLGKYGDMLTRFGSTLRPGPVTVVLSGDRPIELVRKDPAPLCAIDGRTIDLDSGNSKSLVPLISENWLSMFKWLGIRGMPSDQRHRLRDFVAKAHRQGRRVRFWGAPDTPAVWQELWNAGVDYVGSDDLPGLRDFLLSQRRR